MTRVAVVTTAHGRLGLPAEYGLSWVLPRLIGLGRAADLLLSSRVVLAEEVDDSGRTEPEVLERLKDRLQTMREAVERGLGSDAPSVSGLLGGGARRPGALGGHLRRQCRAPRRGRARGPGSGRPRRGRVGAAV